MANYDYVADYSFKPYSFQEMLQPYMLYKEAFEKAEQMSYDLADKAETFSYLSETLPEDSRARKIYENYANDLKAQSDALGQHGLTLGIRSGLSSMRKRYKGEIGRLEKADEAYQKEMALRREMMAKDPTMLYAVNNLSIDNYLDNQTPNNYGISGNSIYEAGLKTGAALANTQYSTGDGGNVIGGYYVDFVQRKGYRPDGLLKDKETLSREFKKEMALNHPELYDAVESGLERLGVAGNLTGVELDRARRNMLDGIIDGAMASYQESHSPQRNPGILSKAEEADVDYKNRSLSLNAAFYGYKWNSKTKGWDYTGGGSKERNSSSPSSKKSSTGYVYQNKGTKIINIKDHKVYDKEDYDKIKSSMPFLPIFSNKEAVSDAVIDVLMKDDVFSRMVQNNPSGYNVSKLGEGIYEIEPLDDVRNLGDEDGVYSPPYIWPDEEEKESEEKTVGGGIDPDER